MESLTEDELNEILIDLSKKYEVEMFNEIEHITEIFDKENTIKTYDG
jgi:hypothetical protein